MTGSLFSDFIIQIPYFTGKGFDMDSKVNKKKGNLKAPGKAVVVTGSSHKPPTGASSNVKDFVMGYTGNPLVYTVCMAYARGSGGGILCKGSWVFF